MKTLNFSAKSENVFFVSIMSVSFIHFNVHFVPFPFCHFSNTIRIVGRFLADLPSRPTIVSPILGPCGSYGSIQTRAITAISPTHRAISSRWRRITLRTPPILHHSPEFKSRNPVVSPALHCLPNLFIRVKVFNTFNKTTRTTNSV